MSDIKRAVYQVVLHGLPLEERGYNGYIKNIFLEQSSDIAPIAKVVLENKGRSLTSDMMFLENSLMDVYLGFNDELTLMGHFILDQPRYTFPPAGVPVILLTGKGESILLAETERRRVHKDITDSELAELIANEHRLTPVIQPTIRRYSQIAQMGVSDINLLRERARLYGYLVYVINGQLHFHSPQNVKTEQVLKYGQVRTQSTLISFDVHTQYYRAAPSVVSSNRDKLKKEAVEVEFDNTPDAAASVLGKSGQSRTAQSIANPEGTVKVFVSNEGHYIDRAEAETQVLGMGRAGQWMVSARAKALGNPNLEPGKLVTLEGLGHFSGQYLIVRSRHHLNTVGDKAYTTELDVVTAALRELTPSRPISVSDSSSSGTIKPDPEADNVFNESRRESIVNVEG